MNLQPSYITVYNPGLPQAGEVYHRVGSNQYYVVVGIGTAARLVNIATWCYWSSSSTFGSGSPAEFILVARELTINVEKEDYE